MMVLNKSKVGFPRSLVPCGSLSRSAIYFTGGGGLALTIAVSNQLPTAALWSDVSQRESLRPPQIIMKIRKAFVMSVHAGTEEEYENRNNPIWPELEKVLKDHGVSNYSIFLHPETRQLFGYAEIENEEQWASIASTEVCQKWWKHMGDIMPSNPDHSPVSAPLREVFHLN
jgi:L-rhamnose mutarotase